MQKTITAAISCALLGVMAPAVAEEAVPASFCAEWKSAVAVDTKGLDKLFINNAKEKPAEGMSYTKKQFAALLGKDLAAAKNVLAGSKDKLPKTSDGLVDLKDVMLNGFNLSGLNLDNVDFKGAEMNGADLSGSSLRGASLYKAELEGANLNHADLSYANAAKATLVKASLCQATLVAADFEDAEMLGAYVKGAKLDRASNVPKAIYLNADGVLHFGLPVPSIK
ncbi:MAG: pentapeptide repeat-containing protein [Nitrosomonadales bacterium]|nr:pentapeptide repeat-containing protein [Nitrosomonadales bacterium]